jgi:hypothetical protein
MKVIRKNNGLQKVNWSIYGKLLPVLGNVEQIFQKIDWARCYLSIRIPSCDRCMGGSPARVVGRVVPQLQ